MTDEELGRKWCAANGKRPKRTSDGYYDWYQPRDLRAVSRQRSANVPAELMSVAVTYVSESAAYAAVGAALRRLWAFAERSKAEATA